MSTVILADGRAVDRVQHELTDADTIAISGELRPLGIDVEPAADIHGVVHLWALVELTTEQEVRALAAFTARTDARLCWHPAVG